MSRRTNWSIEIVNKLLNNEIEVTQVESKIKEIKDRMANRATSISDMSRQQTIDKANLRVYGQALFIYKDKIRPRGQYVRAGIYEIDDVFNMMGQGTILLPDGKKINTNSKRYTLFRQKGTKCVTCGVEGVFFALEKDKTHINNETYHFNLYALVDGQEILMTQDHIKPKSLKGSDDLSNLQPMCMPCNCAKGSKYEEAQDENS